MLPTDLASVLVEERERAAAIERKEEKFLK